MVSQKDNEVLIRIGPGTPMGELTRRYWVPATFSHRRRLSAASDTREEHTP